MVVDFTSLDYLKDGNPRQQSAYCILTEHSVWDKLHPYDPILAGTIPIGIDIPDSDLDILCRVEDHEVFSREMILLFGGEQGFMTETNTHGELLVTLVRFTLPPFELELFGQNIPTQEQNAYRHMLVEHRLLTEHGESFRQAVIRLKEQGMKTEPAFAHLLGLAGDPYQSLLIQ
ncbi:DUF4269 domain-containing protein [Bacteroidales bacterium OttesenSCG-928-L03]|nr:DUF4269 domain-containing protein [Bacteroidales bacterium OttesenSCG-928-L03]